MQSGTEKPLNHGIVYTGPGSVELKQIPYPELKFPKTGRPCPTGAIVKVLVSGICGSDLHMFNGRAGARPGMVFGHEIVGEIVEVGKHVENISKGDLVALPAVISCGRCKNCKLDRTPSCLGLNPEQPGAIFGYVRMGDWQGGQAEYVMVPYADWNCLKLPPMAEIQDKLLDIALLTDVMTTGFHGAYSAGVGVGDVVYIAGAGPVGLACAESCLMLGASHVIVGDSESDRLELARNIGCYTVNVDMPIAPQLMAAVGQRLVDKGIDCVGFEAHSCTPLQRVEPAAALNSVIDAVKSGGCISIPGCYFQEDPGARHEEEQSGEQFLHLGKAWEKGIQIVGMGQHPNMAYKERLLKQVLSGTTDWAKHLNCQVIPLSNAVNAYAQFREGAAVKYFIDPHGFVDKPHESVPRPGKLSAVRSTARQAWKGAKHSIEGAVGTVTDKLKQLVEK